MNIQLPGNGTLVDADDIGGGVYAQGVKLRLGGPGVDGGYVSPSNPLPVKAQPSSGGITDRSSSVAVGGTPVQAANFNAARKYLLIQNPVSATTVLYVNFGSAASTTEKKSVEISPGGSFVQESGFVTTDSVSVVSADSNHPFICKEG